MQRLPESYPRARRSARNLTHYKAEIPQLFWFNALLIASNGTDSRVGSLTADWERFFEVRAGLAVNASSARTSRAGYRWR